MKREAFGMKLIDQPVVRYKFGSMAKEVEALQAWTEQIVYELDHMSYQDGNRHLGGVTALLKVKGGQMNKFVADNCVQIMGGYGVSPYVATIIVSLFLSFPFYSQRLSGLF